MVPIYLEAPVAMVVPVVRAQHLVDSAAAADMGMAEIRHFRVPQRMLVAQMASVAGDLRAQVAAVAASASRCQAEQFVVVVAAVAPTAIHNQAEMGHLGKSISFFSALVKRIYGIYTHG
jgi:hypothetical protein